MSIQSNKKALLEWISRNKISLFLFFCILYALILGSIEIITHTPRGQPVQKEDKKVEQKVDAKQELNKKLASRIIKNKSSKTVIKTYDKESGKLIKEVTREVAENKDIDKKTEVVKKQESKTEQKSDIKTDYKKPHTGLVAGVVVTPSGAGLVAGVTVAEIAPITTSVNVGLLTEPQRSLTAGISVNGEVATNLEVGIGVYVGSQTPLGYTPIQEIPVSIQPGISIQYRF